MKKVIAVVISCIVCSILTAGNQAQGAGKIPSNINNSLIHTVITIPQSVGTDLIKKVHDNAKVTKLILPADISSILPDDYYETDTWLLQNYSSITPNCPNLSVIEVSKANKTFTTKDGVLYSKDMKSLIYCPPGKSGKLVVPEGVVSIGFMAFQECAKLTSVSLPSTLTRINEGAFGNNTKLTSLTVSKDNSYLISKDNVIFYKQGEQLIAYAGGKKNKSYKVPDGVKAISQAAFQGCTNLTEITFCKNLTIIGNEAFRNCTKLKKAHFQEGIHVIAAGAFMNCSSLQKINFPEGLRGIYQDALTGCNQLLDISLPFSLQDVSCNLTDVENRSIQCYNPFITNLTGLELKVKSLKVFTYKNSCLDLWNKKNHPKGLKVAYFNTSYTSFNKALSVAATVAKGTGKPDTSWYQENKEAFRISTPDQLAGLALLVQEGNDFEGKTIELVKDLDLSTYSNWISIGGEDMDNVYVFSGTFDGAGHCIYNMRINKSNGISQGLFGWNNGTIQNLSMQNGQVFTNMSAGILVGTNQCRSMYQ